MFQEVADKESGSPVLPDLNEVILQVAEDVDLLISKSEELGDIDLVRQKYISRMHDRGYISPTGLINQVKLHDDFLQFYPAGILSTFESGIEVDSESNWLRVITRKKLKAVHPIRHLLFIRFLFGDLKSFLEYSKTEFLPFGKPPFPCLNPETDHYKELFIDVVQIKTNHHTSTAQGTFSCPKCGYTYSLNSIDYDASGFECAKVKKLQGSKPKKAINTELETKYKSEITALLSTNPTITRRRIIQQHNMAYRWLYKNDREWLEGRIVSSLKHTEFYKNTRVDWDERDRETLAQVTGAVESILLELPPIRVTVKQIAEVCNYGALPRDLGKMPSTKQFIDTVVELCTSMKD